MQWTYYGEELMISIPQLKNLNSNKDKPQFFRQRRKEFEDALDSASAFKNKEFKFDLETNTAPSLSRIQMPPRPINKHKARKMKVW